MIFKKQIEQEVRRQLTRPVRTPNMQTDITVRGVARRIKATTQITQTSNSVADKPRWG